MKKNFVPDHSILKLSDIKDLIKVMKICLIFLFVFAFQLTAVNSNAQNAVIELKSNTITLGQLIREIEKQTDYLVVFSNREVDTKKEVKLREKSNKVSEYLNEVFSNTGIGYDFENNYIILSKVLSEGHLIKTRENSNQQQTGKTIQGRVTDTNGEVIIGATIIVEGDASKGTITDIDGNYSMQDIPEDAILVVSYVGMTSQRVPLNGRKTINVTLLEDIELLEEVVVIGYGSTRKDDLSMAVSTVKMDATMKSRPSNLTSMIQGSVPGVTIQANGGDPLSSASLTIRGPGSRGNDKVLFVVDGVPNAPYNVEDVETVTVLKDAASAAIYGASVGSGGVIIITTKQAREGKINVDVNVSKGFKQVWRLPETTTSEEYNKVWADATALEPTRTLPIVADPVKYPFGAVTRTNWLDEVFRNAPYDHYAVSLSGGTENLKSFASFSYDNEQGILLNTYSKRIGGKASIDFKMNDWLTVSERITFQHSNGQGNINTTSHEGVLINAVFFPPSATIYDMDKEGNKLYDPLTDLYMGTLPRWAAAEGISGYGEIRNPVATLNRLRQNRPTARLYSTTSIEMKPLRNLSIKSDYTAGLNSSRYEDFSPRVPEPGRPTSENSRQISNTWNTNWLWETIATYSELFNDVHHISAMAGYTMSKENYRYESATTYDFDREDEHYTIWPNASTYAKTKPTEEIWDEAMISMFTRIGYSYNDRYFVNASLRRDATSKMMKGNNSGLFPAISGSWKLSEEAFFAPFRTTFDLFKIRASYGEIGNNTLAPRYSYNVPMRRAPWQAFYGDQLQTEAQGVYRRSISNPNLTWETSVQTGVGIDLTMFNRKLDLSADFFNKLTRDLIEEIPITSTAGIEQQPYGNVGRVLNRGYEFSASYNDKIGKFNYNLFGNLSTVNNEVLDLGERAFFPHDNTINSLKPLRSTVGQPWYSYYLLETDGIFQSQAEVDAYTHEGSKIQPNAQAGDLKFVDHNGDGRINDDDNRYMGSALPGVTYAFGGGFNTSGFDFSFFFQGITDSKVFNGFKLMGLTGRMQGNNMLSDILDSWNYNPDSGIPRLALHSDPNGNYTRASDFYLEDGSYLRLKNVTFGYTLPRTVLNKIGLANSSIRVYLNAENLYTFTKYTGFDPEVGNYGLDGGRYPVPRTYTIGLNLNF